MTSLPLPQVNANGSVLLSEIVGTIKLKVFLSGMPELRLGLNDRVLFELTGRKIWGDLLPRGAQGNPRPGWWYLGTQIAASSEISTRASRVLCWSSPVLQLQVHWNNAFFFF
jgi:hypothetical protein